jgi:CDP-diglyceride synthetase
MVIRFYSYLLAITLFQVGIILAFPAIFVVKDTVISIIFMGILTAAIYPIASIGRKSNDGYTFITTAYISIGLRFILSLCFIVYYKLTRSHYELSFIFPFFASYILYTVFEIYWLTAKLRPILKEKDSTNESNNN